VAKDGGDIKYIKHTYNRSIYHNLIFYGLISATKFTLCLVIASFAFVTVLTRLLGILK